LPAGNALVEGATFFAILLGTIAGGIAVGESGSPMLVAASVVVLAVLCWFAASLMPKGKAAAPDLVIDPNPVSSTMHLIGSLKSEARIWDGALITAGSGWWRGGSVACRC
jgi:acyl-[acyl-carrier-protein]-phospholipid O-acyltransferase/long-chain-fatty-acid--[acyl-carrier-protein] ligase